MGGKVLRKVDDSRVAFGCPGCGFEHIIRLHPLPSPSWDFNGSFDAPTLRPSILSVFPADGDDPAEVCHSFITDGQIQFLGDCTHELAGQTVPLPAKEA